MGAHWCQEEVDELYGCSMGTPLLVVYRVSQASYTVDRRDRHLSRLASRQKYRCLIIEVTVMQPCLCSCEFPILVIAGFDKVMKEKIRNKICGKGLYIE